MSLLAEIAQLLQEGDDEAIPGKVKAALAQGVSPRDVLDRGLLAGMNVIGEQFKNHDIFLPDVLLAAKAMHAGMEVLKPLLADQNIPVVGKIVIGTVQGDLHDIGKNLVGILLKGAGFEVLDLGKDISPERFVETAVLENADFIGMSALLTTTMPTMKRVVELLKERNLTGKIRTIIGGAPVSADFASDIGADAYAFDAANAVEQLKSLLPPHS